MKRNEKDSFGNVTEILERGDLMVTFIPPFMGKEIKSNAERKMFDILQELKLKNAYVLHSLGLPKHQSKIYGEIDFVVVCNRGVVCLEIKGGRVECREGKWFFTDRYGVERERAEGPFAQVIGNMFSIRDVLKKKFPNNPHMKNILIGCGVVFPDIAFKSDSQEIIKEIVYDNMSEDITEYMNAVFDYWQERQHWESSTLAPYDIKEIVNYFRGEFCFIPTLADRLDDVEKRLIRLTAEQVQLMDALAANDRMMIEGNAGTGKTVLALDFAMKRADQGLKVLYLTFNKNLSNNLQNRVVERENLKIINIHALFGEYVTVDIQKMQENPQKYFAETLPDSFFDYISSISEEELETIKYDLLVMDEGQDILKPNYLYSLDCLLKGGLQNGRWVVFYDEKQNIYNPEYKDGMELLELYHSTKFRLFVNCRNTVQIGNYSEKVSGLKLGEFLKENGEEVQKIRYSNDEDFKAKIQGTLKKLKAECVRMSEITFLSPKRYQNSILCKLGVKVNDINEGIDPKLDLPRFSTIHGFKGLDSKIIILCCVDDIYDMNYAKFMYIAATRARTLLYVVGSEEYWKKHND